MKFKLDPRQVRDRRTQEFSMFLFDPANKQREVILQRRLAKNRASKASK